MPFTRFFWGIHIEPLDNTKSPNNSLLGYWDAVAIFCLAVLPDLARSLIVVGDSAGTPRTTFNQLMVLLVVRSLQVSVPILLIMRLRKIRWADYGFVPIRPVRDNLVAIGLMVLGYSAYYVISLGLYYVGQDYTGDSDALPRMTIGASFTIPTVALILVASVANGFAEELAMRSYLIPRLTELFGSAAIAVLSTSVLFASYHIYQGRYGFISALAIGLVLGTYFAITRRFWPIATAHILMDAIPLTMIAYNGG